jgi:DNA-directed RNA polymerase subunit RPC12/RpoP
MALQLSKNSRLRTRYGRQSTLAASLSKKEVAMVFKGCARCGGDMFNEDDLGETELVCLQCGWRRMLSSRFSPEMSEDMSKHVRWLLTKKPARVAA